VLTGARVFGMVLRGETFRTELQALLNSGPHHVPVWQNDRDELGGNVRLSFSPRRGELVRSRCSPVAVPVFPARAGMPRERRKLLRRDLFFLARAGTSRLSGYPANSWPRLPLTKHDFGKPVQKPDAARGWLPPSLQSRVDNVIAWVERYRRWAPITHIVVERVRFDTQWSRWWSTIWTT
jgi:hypothetical protein